MPHIPRDRLPVGTLGLMAVPYGLAVLATLPALALRLTGAGLPPPAAALLFGLGVLGAGFLLSWAAEAAEAHISPGLTLALLALVTVLPEYAVDVYYTYQAGLNPGSKYVQYAAANMTGANRLLIGLAWPLVALLGWVRTGRRAVTLRWENSAEVAFLGVATLYSFVIVLKGRITLFDALVLLGIFAAYLWRVSGTSEAVEEEVVGPAAAIGRLPRGRQYVMIAGLITFAAAVILAAAEPFAESLVGVGREWGIDEFLLIQWLAPLASEAPAVVVAILYCLRGRPANGLGVLASDKINQWTLLVGMLPIVYSVAAGHPAALPLDERQREEFFLTAAQSAFAVAVLMRRRLGPAGAVALFSLFAGQLAVSFALRADEARSVRVLTEAAWVYLVLAAMTLLWTGRRAWDFALVGLFNRPAPADQGPRGDEGMVE